MARREQYLSAILGAQIACEAYDYSAAQSLLEGAPFELRGWEHAYLTASLDRSTMQLRGVIGVNYRMSSTSDGTRLVSASYDTGPTGPYLWSVDDGELIAEFGGLEGFDHFAQDIAFSPDGDRILTVGSSNAELWDGHTGIHLHTLGTSDAQTRAARFSVDGKFVLTAAGAAARVWGVGDGQLSYELCCPNASVWVAEFSPDGRSIVTGLADGTVLVWDIESRKERLQLAGHDNAITRIVFNADGSRIATGSGSDIRVWDLQGKEIARRAFGEHSEFPMAFLHSSLLVGSSDDVRLWDLDSDLPEIRWPGHFTQVSPDGRLVLVWGGTEINIRDARTGALVTTLQLEHPVEGVCWIPDRERVVASSLGAIRVWDYETSKRQQLASLDLDLAEDCVRFSMQGNLLGACALDGLIVRDAASGAELARVADVSDAPLAFDLDGERVAASREGDLCVFSLHTGRELARLPDLDPDAIAFLDGRSVLVSSSWDWQGLYEKLSIVSLDSGDVQATLLETNDDVIRVVAAALDGSTLAAGGGGGRVRVWSGRSGKLLWSEQGHGARITSLAFSKDCSLLVTAGEDGLAVVWDASTGAELRRLVHGQRLHAAIFSPDDRRVVTAGHDVRLWELDSGRQLLSLSTLDDVVAVAFRDAGTRLVTVSSDGEVETYDSVPARERVLERKGQ